MKHSKIFSFCNQKGGVGKTTTAINLSASIAELGYDVLLVDIDPQANATSGLGDDKSGSITSVYQILADATIIESAIRKTPYKNLSLIPSTPELSGAEIELISFDEREFRLRNGLELIRNRFDFIFIDCPPSLGLLTLNALVASDFVFIPLQCEYYALEGLGQLVQTFSLVKTKLSPGLELGAVLLTMADFRTKLTEQVIKEVRDYFKERVFETMIPRSVRLSEAPSFGKPGIVYDRNSRGAKSYLEAADEFLRRFPPAGNLEGARVGEVVTAAEGEKLTTEMEKEG